MNEGNRPESKIEVILIIAGAIFTAVIIIAALSFSTQNQIQTQKYDCFESKTEDSFLLEMGCGNGICEIEEDVNTGKKGTNLCIDCLDSNTFPACRIKNEFEFDGRIIIQVDYNGKSDLMLFDDLFDFCGLTYDNNSISNTKKHKATYLLATKNFKYEIVLDETPDTNSWFEYGLDINTLCIKKEFSPKKE